MESELKTYRVYLRCTSEQYGHFDVEATDKNDAVDKAYDMLNDDEPDDIDYGDGSDWEVQDVDNDVELVSEIGRMPISMKTNFTTGYKGQELMLL